MPESVVVYTYANCSTCRDAIGWLREHGIAFDERPIYQSPPSIPELRRMLAVQNGGLRRLFNTSGLEYRALDLKTKLPRLSEPQALELLSGNGKLVKRPFLLGKPSACSASSPTRGPPRSSTDATRSLFDLATGSAKTGTSGAPPYDLHAIRAVSRQCASSPNATKRPTSASTAFRFASGPGHSVR